MILEDNLIVSNNDLIYPFATSQSTFNSYLGKFHKEKAKYLKIIESWMRFIYNFCKEITYEFFTKKENKVYGGIRIPNKTCYRIFLCKFLKIDFRKRTFEVLSLKTIGSNLKKLFN